jgi:hypothetical protein
MTSSGGVVAARWEVGSVENRQQTAIAMAASGGRNQHEDLKLGFTRFEAIEKTSLVFDCMEDTSLKSRSDYLTA